jgi:hypothetical protein
MTRYVPLPVELTAAGPAQQRRWTVLIRWIMLIPHYVVLYVLGIVSAVVAFIGWWGALFTGLLPEFAVSYLSGYTRWSTRVQAYALLLTDQYPPFSLDDKPSYPVRIAIPPRDRLNRVAVLFRVILAIPASLLNALVAIGGTTIVAFIAWLIALITGKLPTSLHQAYTAILRYTTRLSCYSYMLTAAYPRGLFGDGTAVPPAGDFAPAASGYEAPAAPAASGDETPVAPAAPGDGTLGDEVPVVPADSGDEVPVAPAGSADETSAAPGYGTLGYGIPGYGASGYGAPGYGALGYGIPGYETPAAWQSADWRLLLVRGAKQLLGWFIGIGVVIWVAWIVVATINSANGISTSNAIHVVNTANNTLTGELNNYQKTVQACTNAACVETADAQAATAFTNFASTVHGTPMPGSAVAAANKVYSEASEVAQDLTRLSHLSPTISASQYESTANSTGIGQTSTQLQQDISALSDALNISR